MAMEWTLRFSFVTSSYLLNELNLRSMQRMETDPTGELTARILASRWRHFFPFSAVVRVTPLDKMASLATAGSNGCKCPCITPRK